MQLLARKIALVTGAGRGLGAAIAEGLAAAGASLVIVDIDPATVEATAADLRAKGFQAVGAVLEVTDRAAVMTFAADFTRHHGRLDVLVNNRRVPASLTALGTLQRIATRRCLRR